MDAIIRFLQDTGFYLFSQDGNWRCLIMLGRLRAAVPGHRKEV